MRQTRHPGHGLAWTQAQGRKKASDNPLHGAAFVLAAHRPDQLPSDAGAEIAFAGRSNAGKSSALNALTGHSSLARTSKTPGRTQQLVVFALPEKKETALRAGRRLVDLPGYGYAKVPPALRDHWRHAIDYYLRKRQSLRGLVLIADIRHALTAFDRQMLAFCADIELPCVVLLSKADKLSRAQARARQREVDAEIAKQHWHAQTIAFSATAGTGLNEARAAVAALLGEA
ncbi:MAG TPA: ribosome biogenesis GTP-binding protein YihA/YsxC [Rhodanobacteraceae bacterium]|nr:ribosome biogenesis GTP-binding protein YihA/YsxC [Rhodanobacteraceae bacterium]